MDDISGNHIRHMLRPGRSIMNENPSTRPIFAAQSSEVNFPKMGVQPFEAAINQNSYYAGNSAYGDNFRHRRNNTGIKSGLNRRMESA